MRFTLDPNKFTIKLLSSLSKKQEAATVGLVDVIKSMTPEDTGKMVSSYAVLKPHIEGYSIVTGVTNSAMSRKGYKYPHVVDKGVGITYSYQKPKGNRGWYIGDGVNLFTRSVDAFKQTFLHILKE